MAAIEVDLKGLAKLLERRGVEWLALELIQNAWDTSTESVNITIKPIPSRAEVEIVVEDTDPEGFVELSHAWTLFAESLKKDNPQQRGRFNMGEKLVLAYCLAYGGEVTITTTKGRVHFDANKGRKRSKVSRDSGSEIRCRCRMTRAQMAASIDAIKSVIPPVPTFLNGEKLPMAQPIAFVDMSLPTEIADEEGVLRRTSRRTSVAIYELKPNEKASIYELGLPVVETGDKWHYDVQQKVPLNMERDNVTPAFLKTIRVHVLNHMHSVIDKEDATQGWVRQATDDKRCSAEATEVTMTHMFGRKRVAYDPTDPEANKIAVSRGYTVVHGGSLSKGQWSNVKDVGTTKAAGQVTPSPKPYSDGGDPEKIIDPSQYTKGMRRVVRWAEWFHREVFLKPVSVRMVREPHVPWIANYGGGMLALNYSKLGKAWFEDETFDGWTKVNDLLIHEYAHRYSSDHFSHRFLDGATDLGAKLGALMYRRGRDSNGLWE